MSTPVSKLIVQVNGKPVEQPKVLIPETSWIHDKIVLIPDYTIPHIRFRDDSSSRRVNRNSMQDINRKLPTCPDPTYRPLPKPIKSPMPEVPGSLSDIDSEINTDL